MPFTQEEINAINEGKKVKYVSHVRGMKREIQELLTGVDCPDPAQTDEKYVKFFEDVNKFFAQIRGAVSSPLNANEEFEDAHNKEKILSQSFGAMTFDGEEFVYPRNAENKPVTLNTLIDRYKKFAVVAQGEAYQNEEFRKVGKVIGKLMNARDAYHQRRLMYNSEEEMLKMAILKKKVIAHHNELKVHTIDAYKETGMEEDSIDFADLEGKQNEITRAEAEKAEKIRILETERPKLEAEFSKKEKEIQAIIDENTKLYAEIAKYSDANKVLDQINMQLDETLTKAGEVLNTYKAWKVKVAKATSEGNEAVLSFREADRDYDSAKSSYENIVRNHERYLQEHPLTEGGKLMYQQALKLDTQIEKQLEQVDVLNSVEDYSQIDYWLDGYTGDPENNDEYTKFMQKKAAEDAEKYKDVQLQPGSEEAKLQLNRLAAKKAINYYMENRGLTYGDVKATLGGGKIAKFAENVAVEYGKLQKTRGDLVFKGSDNKFDFSDYIAQVKYYEKGIAVRKQLLDESTTTRAFRKAKADKAKEIYEACKERMEDKSASRWLRKTLDNFKMYQNNKDIDQKFISSVVKELADVDKKLDVHNGMGLAAKYNEVVGGLEWRCDQIKKSIVQAKEKNAGKSKEIEAKIAENIKKAEEMKKQAESEKIRKLDELTTQVNIADKKVQGLTAARDRQRVLYNVHNRFKNELRVQTESAKEYIANMDKQFCEQVIANLIQKYKCLNDARKDKSNSSYYRKMVQPLCEILGVEVPVRGEDLRGKVLYQDKFIKDKNVLVEKLADMQVAAKEYLAKRDKDKWFPSNQRLQRIDMAKQLDALCEDSLIQVMRLHKFECEKFDQANKSYSRRVEALENMTASIVPDSPSCKDDRDVFDRAINKVDRSTDTLTVQRVADAEAARRNGAARNAAGNNAVQNGPENVM